MLLDGKTAAISGAARPLGRLGEAAYVTGAVIDANGGMLIHG
jgi:hypothetical protein